MSQRCFTHNRPVMPGMHASQVAVRLHNASPTRASRRPWQRCQASPGKHVLASRVCCYKTGAVRYLLLQQALQPHSTYASDRYHYFSKPIQRHVCLYRALSVPPFSWAQGSCQSTTLDRGAREVGLMPTACQEKEREKRGVG